MKRNALKLFVALFAVAGLLAMPASAELGLQQIAQTQGAAAVGQAVLAAAKAVYAGSADPAVIQAQLIAILNEAAATGNQDAVRYALVAVMLAGGTQNLALSKEAIDNSNAFTSYEALVAATVSEAEALMLATGGDEGTGSGGTGGDGGGNSGGGPSVPGIIKDLKKDPPDPENPFPPPGSGDGDLPATRT